MTPAFLVSVLFNEPKLLKLFVCKVRRRRADRFSALQRAEIAENAERDVLVIVDEGFSALQRAEIAETAFTSPTA